MLCGYQGYLVFLWTSYQCHWLASAVSIAAILLGMYLQYTCNSPVKNREKTCHAMRSCQTKEVLQPLGGGGLFFSHDLPLGSLPLTYLALYSFPLSSTYLSPLFCSLYCISPCQILLIILFGCLCKNFLCILNILSPRCLFCFIAPISLFFLRV